jgi:hypothetical protein
MKTGGGGRSASLSLFSMVALSSVRTWSWQCCQESQESLNELVLNAETNGSAPAYTVSSKGAKEKGLTSPASTSQQSWSRPVMSTTRCSASRFDDCDLRCPGLPPMNLGCILFPTGAPFAGNSGTGSHRVAQHHIWTVHAARLNDPCPAGLAGYNMRGGTAHRAFYMVRTEHRVA